jgi:hypothetical protein
MLQRERGTHECFIVLHLKKLSGGQRSEWWSDRGIVQVGFDANERLLWKRFVDVNLLREPTLPDRLPPWLGR